MFLSPQQIAELFDILDTFSLKFAVQNVSDQYLTPAEKKRLTEAGINPKTITPTFDNAFKYGMISEALGDDAKSVDFATLKRRLRTKQFLPLDYREKQALDSLKYQAYNEIRGLGNKINMDTQRIQVEVDRAQRLQYEKVIRDAAKKAIIDRQSVKQMASEIGHKTQDWARDLDRISDFIMHNAHDMGRAMQIKRAHGQNAEVYKHVFDQACSTCVKLYLTSGMGSQPRVFKVDELIANGSNIGRKQKDWKPVIGATHPWCRCQLESLPKGEWEWDAENQRFKMKLNKREQEIKSKIKFELTLDD